MSVATGRRTWLLRGFLCALAVGIPASSVQARTFTIQFGGSVGLAYSPSSVSVSVGDTITWVGNFSFHPLSSVTLPAGAASWRVASGSSFSYPVLVAGSYTYQCDAHFDGGMTGSFVATTTGLEESGGQPEEFRLDQNYPNPFNPSTVIGYTLPVNSQVSLTIFNMLGEKVGELVNGSQYAGQHEIRFDGSGLASGVYFYRLEARPVGDGTRRNLVATRQLVLVK